MSLSFRVPSSNLLRMLEILNQILAFILPAQTSLRTWACSWQMKPWLIVHIYRFNSIIFWSEPLLLIFWYENRNSFVFKLWSYPDISIIRCLAFFPSSDWVLILTSDPLRTAESFVGLLSGSFLHIQNFVRSSLIHIAFGKLYPLPSQPWSAIELVLFYSWSLWYMFPRCPYGLNLCHP